MTENRRMAYSIKHAAEQVDISERKLRELIAAGHIATVRPPGTSHPKITHAELEAWLEAGS
ncbi:helix-turn-helix domain-containing protein [Nesterenkonia haasae]|uniref:helix-turn-helix domain-containing protein n=1 Tax=Nesterenkonia haasae TaxID=2587813 RepID=UPI0013909A49|nr:helix-turn-helix domain-containing protein [Nesterenkonia haasae]